MYFLGSEILTLTAVKSSIFWNIIPCSSLQVNRSFGGTYRLHLQIQRVSQARNQRSACCLVFVDILSGLLFDSEDVREAVLRNMGCFSLDHTALYTRRWNSSEMYMCELLIWWFVFVFCDLRCLSVWYMLRIEQKMCYTCSMQLQLIECMAIIYGMANDCKSETQIFSKGHVAKSSFICAPA
jgi:hypothetical protein